MSANAARVSEIGVHLHATFCVAAHFDGLSVNGPLVTGFSVYTYVQHCAGVGIRQQTL